MHGTDPISSDHLRILAIAYACDPTKGSESGVGWGWVRALAQRHRVTVVTADYNRPNIEKHLCSEVAERLSLRFLYVKNRPWHYHPSGAWLKVETSLAKPLMNLAYQDWLRCAFEDVKNEVARTEYDLVHLITYVGWRFPGTFYKLPVPFVWGPIGGLMNTPWRFLPAMGLKGMIYYGGRNLINSLQLLTLRGPRKALQRANGAVIAATNEIGNTLWRKFRTPSYTICEVGLPEVSPQVLRSRQSGEPLRICWSAEHLPGKALHLLLRAAARLPKDLRFTIQILGDGPSSRSWRNLAQGLGISAHCQWHGKLPRKQALEVMKTCHIFVITSLKDLTSTVSVEALALALPIVCLNHCGFADLVTDQCGIKVSPTCPNTIVAGIAEAIAQLYDDEVLRLRLAGGALERSLDYSWSSKMRALTNVYRIALKKTRTATLERVLAS